MSYGYFGPYIEVKMESLKKSNDFECFKNINKLRDVQYYIDCGLPSILIPRDNYWLDKNSNYRPKRYHSDLLDLSNFDMNKIIEEFKISFKDEIDQLDNRFLNVQVKFGWINNIEE